MVPKHPEGSSNGPQESADGKQDAAKARIGNLTEEFAGMYSDGDYADAAKSMRDPVVLPGGPMYDEDFGGPVSAPRGNTGNRYNDEDGVFGVLPPAQPTAKKKAAPAKEEFDDGSMYGGIY